MDTKEIISIVVAGIAGAVWAILEIRRWRKNKRQREMEVAFNLDENPTRCTKHELRLNELEKACVSFSGDIKNVKESVERIDKNVDKLLDLHLKP